MCNCKVLNNHHKADTNSIYIGRGSKWGNPFVIGKDGDRDTVCDKYEDYLLTRPELIEALDKLKGFNLVCYCSPLRCHGDLLLRLANSQAYLIEWLERKLHSQI